MLDSLAVDLAEGDAPGLIAAYPYQLDYFDSELYSVSLSGYFDDPTWGFDETVREDIPQVFLDQFIVDGNLIALPITPQGVRSLDSLRRRRMQQRLKRRLATRPLQILKTMMKRTMGPAGGW